jgi:hypothetical protein
VHELLRLTPLAGSTPSLQTTHFFGPCDHSRNPPREGCILGTTTSFGGLVQTVRPSASSPIRPTPNTHPAQLQAPPSKVTPSAQKFSVFRHRYKYRHHSLVIQPTILGLGWLLVQGSKEKKKTLTPDLLRFNTGEVLLPSEIQAQRRFRYLTTRRSACGCSKLSLALWRSPLFATRDPRSAIRIIHTVHTPYPSDPFSKGSLPVPAIRIWKLPLDALTFSSPIWRHFRSRYHWSPTQ